MEARDTLAFEALTVLMMTRAALPMSVLPAEHPETFLSPLLSV